MLYICLNKANQMEASNRFGPNVECRTSHSLAYRAVGHKYASRLARGWRAVEFANQHGLTDYRVAAKVQAVLKEFFSSTDNKVKVGHALAVADKWDIELHEFEPLVTLASMAWSKIISPSGTVGVTDDAYLKIWALSKPKLDQYTHIILDEAQDTNPVTAQIVEGQSHATRLLIGDRHQSIYQFRGAKNAMEQFAASGATVLKMPKTWRFGPEIAGLANTILGFFKDEETAIIGAGPKSARESGDKWAVLSRTNAGLFGEAAAVMGRHTHWVGGIQNYRTELLNDTYLLKTGRRSEIKDSYIRGFASWGQYCDAAEEARDAEAKALIKLNTEYGKDVPLLVDSFHKNALPTEAGAQLVLTTAHKSKGLEFDRVKIGDDFDCLDSAYESMLTAPGAPLNSESAQEINLLYVACTRARHRLELNATSAQFIKHIERNRSDLLEAKSNAQRAAASVLPGSTVTTGVQPALAAEASLEPGAPINF